MFLVEFVSICVLSVMSRTKACRYKACMRVIHNKVCAAQHEITEAMKVLRLLIAKVSYVIWREVLCMIIFALHYIMHFNPNCMEMQ